MADQIALTADARPGDGLCETSTGDCSVRAAVQESNASAGADTIELGDVESAFEKMHKGEVLRSVVVFGK